MTMWLVQNKPCPLMPEKQRAQLLTWDLQQSAKALVSFKEVPDSPPFPFLFDILQLTNI